ncbi:MAG TPA: aminotransferase class V-fold PLP-dependent enzyme [Candidatus Saccharimonadales bacterium]|nr:aminotransferase class V-fold PLP-dependent enzyme [Candidatus Saccharimonadales bacterium]
MIDFRSYVVSGTDAVPVTGGQRPYINLDNAASTPPFKKVLEAVSTFAPWYASVHRGNGYKSRLSTAMYEESRAVVRDFVGADAAAHTVIFVKNTTEAINKLSYRLRLRRDDIVLISHLEHHSNDLPWRARATVKRIATLPDGSVSREDYVRLLDYYGMRIKLVALSGASNVTGHVPDIHWFARHAHHIGARIFIDCAQRAAHRPIDMRRLDDPEHLDYIAFSAHKMYAPFGGGALVGRRDTFMQGDPEYVGGGTIASVTTKYVDWAAPPESEEAGSPNVIGAVTLATAIKTLQDIGLKRIGAHEADLTAYALRTLKKVPKLTLYGNQNPQVTANRSGVIPFTIEGVPAQLVAACLGFEWGIGVRSGCFCAQPYVMSLLGLNPNHVRSSILHHRRDTVAGLVRASIGLYNTPADIDTLAAGLTAIARGDHADYVVDPRTGYYKPQDTQEDFSSCFTA